ncbi:hypothetical protein DPMN_070663 [Dreissena polymorpha]|uniref:Uncharacterized protein n=1 Tax=Dreissena polymorpha TaxID=45954 RepID=A0A9D3Z6C7_DREPO|nr:hypothetical protein DPMN_070663 [Dreissena polymorpha]
MLILFSRINKSIQFTHQIILPYNFANLNIRLRQNLVAQNLVIIEQCYYNLVSQNNASSQDLRDIRSVLRASGQYLRPSGRFPLPPCQEIRHSVKASDHPVNSSDNPFKISNYPVKTFDHPVKTSVRRVKEKSTGRRRNNCAY